MTVSDLEPDVQVRTRTAHSEPGSDQERGERHLTLVPSAENVRPESESDPGDDHAVLSHLGEMHVAVADGWLVNSIPMTIRAAAGAITPDAEERDGMGRLEVAALSIGGVLRLIFLTGLWAAALAVGTRQRAGAAGALGALLFTIYVTAQLLR